MDSSQKTLIEIASVSQRVVNAITRSAGCKSVETFRLDRVIISCGSILEILNMKLLPENGHVDDRLVDWLNSKEPRVCLDTLNQMEEILDKKVEYGANNFFKTLRSASAQGNTDKAIKLFRMRQSYFHFLLTTDIWNREPNIYQRSHGSVNCNTQRTEGAPDIQETELLRGNSGYTSGVPRGNPVNQEKLNNILGRLNALHSKDIHRRTLFLRQPDTCKWLPNTKEFKAWRRTKNSFLWLHGKAGAGKSVLTASVIEHLQNTLQDGELLLYFYCDFRNQRSINTAEVMRSLLSQLLQPSVHPSIKPGSLIDDLEKEAALIVDDLALLASCISRAAQYFNQQPICIIDALDECNDIGELLNALVQLRKGGIRFFVTSRPLQVIKDDLSRLPSISMDTMNFEVAADIALHVKRELDSHRRLRILEASLKTEIGSALCDKADGMFRWVHCQLNTLKRCMTAVQIRKTLDDLPRDLDATYSRILLGIDKNDWDIVRQALYWLVAAFRPLKLCQILEGLSIDLERRVLDHGSRPVHGPALLDALGSLVTYDELMDLVTLSHASVKEYLIADSTHTKYPSYHIATQDAHSMLALLCTSYIPAYLKQQAQSNGHASRNAYKCMHPDSSNAYGSPVPPSSESYPLLAYVRYVGFWHLEYVDPADKKVISAIETFESDVRLHPTEWERFRKGPNVFELDLPALEHDLVLYILIAFAPAQLLRLYIGDAQLKQKDGTNPLTYAALHGRLEHGTILLDKGACVGCRGWDLDGHHQILPLETVVAHGQNTQMVDLFLTEGSPVPYELFEQIMEDRRSFSPLVTLKLLQTDEFAEWASGVLDKNLLIGVLESTLFNGWFLRDEGYEADIDAIERRLVQIGCNLQAWFDETSLRDAVRAGHISIVKRMLLNGNIPLPPDIVLDATSWDMIRFLLDLGNDIHVTSPRGDTLLHLVMRSPKEVDLETTRSIVSAGCNTSACNLAGELPLHVAVTAHGHSGERRDIVEYLLSLDVPIPPDILLVAFECSTISFLVDAGANVHSIAANGDTVLHAALRYNCQTHIQNWHNGQDQCLEIVKLLINAGCNPRLPNVLGETPLDVAVKGGHYLAVRYLASHWDIPLPSDILLSVVGLFSPTSTPLINFLLDNGADVHAVSPNGDNLLCISVADGPLLFEVTEKEHIRRIKILMGAGCSPHVCNKAGESLIHVAARKRYTIVLEYLVSLGLPVPSNLMNTQFQDNHPHSSSMLDTQITHFLLDKGCNMCVVAENGETLLHLAARAITEKDAVYLAKLLVQSGCSPSAPNSNKETPFHVASRSGYTSVISYFLSLGAPLPSDIMLAASTGLSERATVIRYLNQHGADATSTDAISGATPLHWLFAHDTYRPTITEYDRLQCAKILIEAGCDPKSEDLDGKTPMHFAARRGHISIIEYLLSRDIPPPHDILFDSTAKVFRFFLRHGVNVQSFIPILPLHHILGTISFSEGDCLERASILISAGCDPSVQNWLGETPLHIAARNNHIAIVKYLLSQNAALPSDILLAAVSSKVPAYVGPGFPLLRFLIQQGADVNASADDGDTPLHLVLRDTISFCEEWARGLLWDAIEVLLNGGANPFIRNADGKSAFDLTEEGGKLFKDNFLRLVRNSTARQIRTIPSSGERDPRSNYGADTKHVNAHI